ncbi:MAG TPA: filamentous hemagglutinin N-terminal domain-containing protein, partial [Rhodospirillales bacterium]|nr:filamentous hemagglutinin N-terminal domain-containing protein [Rhodospirillales bacterium]
MLMNKSIRIRSVRSLLQSVLLGVALGTSPGVLADASLPVACGGGGCSGRAWVADRSLSSFSRSADGTALLINQAEKRQTFNWESFNVAPGNRVDFKQPGKDAVALNRIFDANPSQIMGNVTATGQIILYNRNGILFGNGAQINVGSLTATTLDVEDDVFNSAGILGAVEQSKAAFVATGPMGSVTVEEGATITTTDAQGRVLIMAPSIENRGTIVTRDGQTVLAASQDKVYLQASGDPALRGILVEVETGGDVSNLGSIIAERGNVTLMGLAVNQQGIVRATTSVRANGSIRLLARDQGSIQASGNRVSLISRHAGDLTLGNNSKTEVLLDETDSSSAIDTQTQLPSTIEGMGKTIHLKSGAAITATSGEVSLVARTNPTDASVADRNTRIYLDEGAKIDVSGATTASLSAQDNLIEVELRSNELRDAPQQRNGPLRNQTIVVDIRKGTPLADISGTLETRQRTLGERMAAGGTINLESQGDVIVKSGTMLDVSGGHISFRPGTIGTTKLISEGRIIDIGEADPGLRYEGIFTAIPLKTFSPGYIEGKDAGQLNILAPGGVVLQGDVKGATSRGVFQRDLPRSLGGRAAFTRSASEMPLGGRLNIDGRLAGATAFGQNPSVLFSSGAGSAAASAVTDALAADMPLVINADWFGERRFNRLSIDSSGRIRLPESVALDMGVGGGIALSGGDVDLLGEITAPAGGIDVSLDGTSVNPVKSLVVGDKAVLDVSGLWVNDLDVPGMVSRQLPVAIAGGTISLDGSGDSTVAGDATLSLGERSIIDVSGGAWLGADRKITAGKG